MPDNKDKFPQELRLHENDAKYIPKFANRAPSTEWQQIGVYHLVRVIRCRYKVEVEDN